MANSKKIGWLYIWLISLIPVMIWALYMPLKFRVSDYSSITHSLGQLFALIGVTMFAVTFILSTRWKFLEKYFGGMDKVYNAHHILGAIAFVLLLFHPLLLVFKFIPSNIKRAAIYLLPSNSLAVNLGIIALSGMILLMVLTLFIKLKYRTWKFSHKFLGAFFIIAFLHTLLISSDVSRNIILRSYIIFVSSVGILAFFYSLILRSKLHKKHIYFVDSVFVKDNKFITINLKPKNEKMSFRTGQFVFITFYDRNISKEQHPFTIASDSNEHSIRLVVKSLGDYTKSLVNLKGGIVAELEGPYGNFDYHPHRNEKQVWIAGGIGITPFIGMAEHMERSNVSLAGIDLYYCVKNKEHAIYLEKFNEVASKVKGFRIIPVYSEEQGRLNVKKIVEISNGLNDKVFLLCGPENMVAEIEKQLIKNKVTNRNIHREFFGFK